MKKSNEKIKKECYWEPLNKNMYDCCYCMSKTCDCPCGRRPSASNEKERELEKYITMADFSEICDHYVPHKYRYVLSMERPRIDPTCPHQRNNGYFIEREVELSKEELQYLLEQSARAIGNYNDRGPSAFRKIRKILGDKNEK